MFLSTRRVIKRNDTLSPNGKAVRVDFGGAVASFPSYREQRSMESYHPSSRLSWKKSFRMTILELILHPSTWELRIFSRDGTLFDTHPAGFFMGIYCKFNVLDGKTTAKLKFCWLWSARATKCPVWTLLDQTCVQNPTLPNLEARKHCRLTPPWKRSFREVSTISHIWQATLHSSSNKKKARTQTITCKVAEVKRARNCSGVLEQHSILIIGVLLFIPLVFGKTTVHHRTACWSTAYISTLCMQSWKALRMEVVRIQRIWLPSNRSRQ